MKKREQNIRPVRHHQVNPLCIMGVPEREKERKGQKERLRKKWLKYCPIWWSTWIYLQIQETQEILNNKNLMRTSPRYIIIRIESKHKREFWSKREVIHRVQGSSVRLTGDFSSVVQETRRQWNDLLKVLKGKKKSAN